MSPLSKARNKRINGIGVQSEFNWLCKRMLVLVSFFKLFALSIWEEYRTIVPIEMFDKSTKIYRFSMLKVNVVWDGAQCGMPPADFFLDSRQLAPTHTNNTRAFSIISILFSRSLARFRSFVALSLSLDTNHCSSAAGQQGSNLLRSMI